MSYDCSLIRYSPEFTIPVPIHSLEWEALVQAHPSFRLASALLPNDTLELLTTATIASLRPAYPPPTGGVRGFLTKLRKFWKRKQPVNLHSEHEEIEEVWLGILSLSAGEATFPNIAFQQDSILEALLDIATELQACMVGQEGEVYFVPGIGLTWSESVTSQTLFASMDEVEHFVRKHGVNYGSAAQQQMKRRGW
jgi:hypothetical protein